MLFGRTGGKVVRSNAVKLSVSLRENTALLASVWVKMPADRKPMRFAHSEGHTDVCYEEKGE